MEPTVYGYARVSSRDQNLSRQLDAFADFGIARKHIYSDKASGKDFERPAYKRLMAKLRRGDTLVIKSIDRLGRGYEEILAEWHRITKGRGACIVVLDMPLLDTRERPGDITGALIADLMLQLLSYVAHIEREHIHQRQAEGIAAAKARGVSFGRPRKEKPRGWPAIRDAYKQGAITRKEAAGQLGVSVGTFGRWLQSDDASAVEQPTKYGYTVR